MRENNSLILFIDFRVYFFIIKENIYKYSIMNLFMQNSFTQTFGYGETISKSFSFDKNLLKLPHLSQWAITNINLLKAKKETSLSHRLGKIIANLENLWTQIGKEFWIGFIDPIEYIIYLYFKENLSIENIFIRINWKWISYKNSSSLTKLLTLTFWWELKDASENKTTSFYIKRDASNSIAKTLERKDTRKAEFISWFIQHSHIDMSDFDSNLFEKYRFKYEKLMYVICEVFHISKKDFLSLPKELEVGEQSLADRFNEQFELYNIPLHVSHKDIHRTFEKFTPYS